MEEKNYTGAVPENEDGRVINAESKVELHSEAEAESFFATASARLMDVNNWNKLAGGSLAEFTLADASGNPLSRTAEEGLLIRIDIPGPGTASADGYDWVEIEEVKQVESGDVQSMAIRVRPVSPPLSDDDAPAHFYSKKSSSTFTLSREGSTVTAAVYDRNIEENKESENLIDKVRNAVVGFMGKQVFSKIQWQALADGLLSR